jgi:DNA polymerase-3 subunit epsilon
LHKTADEYNSDIEVAVQWLKDQLPTFAYLDKGLDDNDYSCILILEGNFYGMGYIDDLKADTENLTQLQQKLEPIPTNDFIRNLVLKHATAFPEKCILYN